MKWTPERMKRAVQARTPAELLKLAKAEGLELTGAEAEDYFGKLHPPAGELADDELEAVSGGGCGGGGTQAQSPTRPMDGMVVDMGNEARCQVCGHQATFMVWDTRSDGRGGSIVGRLECPACHAMYEYKNGAFEKAQDQTRPDGFGPVMA